VTAAGGLSFNGDRLPLYAYPLLALLCLALYLPGFADIPPFDRDESRFAQASRQMSVSGDFVDIRFQDEARHKKPVGIYWLQVAATRLLADDPLTGEIWTFRVPSALGATLAVLLTAWGGARLFGPSVGAAAAVMLASCVVLGVEARMAKTDAVLTACVALAQFILAWFYTRRDAQPGTGALNPPGTGVLNPPGTGIILSPGTGAAVALWSAVAVGVLIKGPLILLFCGGTMLMLAAWDRSFAWMKPLRWRLGGLIVLGLAAPWLIAITLKTGGAFFTESVGHDMMGKVAGGQEGKGLPPGYYLGTFWITFFPWAFGALLAAPWVWRNRHEPAVRFCVAWIIPAWLVFEATPTKLLHYTLPVFPAIALLSAGALLDPAWGLAAGGRRLSVRVAGGLFMAVAVALCLAVAGIIPALDGRVDGPAAVGATAALLGFAFALRFALDGRTGRFAAACLTSALVLYVSAFGRALPQVEAPWPSRWAATQIAALKPCPESVTASAGFSEPSLVFSVGTATKLTRGEGAAAHLAGDPACGLALVEGREEAVFHAGLGNVGVEVLARGTGVNYNNGRRLTLTLYRARP
jgi:4-amino-4-deoxy-L-arabinose transferase-like glycosyltransferase